MQDEAGSEVLLTNAENVNISDVMSEALAIKRQNISKYIQQQILFLKHLVYFLKMCLVWLTQVAISTPIFSHKTKLFIESYI